MFLGQAENTKLTFILRFKFPAYGPHLEDTSGSSPTKFIKRSLARIAFVFKELIKLSIQLDLLKQQEIEHKKIALEYFKLISSGKYKEGLRFFASECKTHNPFVSGSVENLTDAMIAASKDLGAQSKEPSFSVRNILADGDLVAVHTEFLNSKSQPGEGGLRQVHLFRFEGDKIAEYWDITQQVLSDMPNASGAF